ncbi:hypothetical protein E2C01_027708 [Portunus trituberculatus]|uniref:Uncharacterized protein n=1 Tax=Portunus trituberculatus TaxID=210409 RepID=A0A5B7EPL0_PORTR|nr:hypothetical protein [Portunus trituberculatus]
MTARHCCCSGQAVISVGLAKLESKTRHGAKSPAHQKSPRRAASLSRRRHVHLPARRAPSPSFDTGLSLFVSHF